MPALNITNSSNVASLDFNVLSDYCEGYFTVDLSSTVWIGAGASNVLGANVKITNPLNVVIKQFTTSGYDIYPPMTEVTYVNIPTQASNYQYGTYTVEVQLIDANGTIYTLSKQVKISYPDSKNKNRNYGSLSATLDGNCVTGRVVIIADTPPNYQGFSSDSQVNDFLLKYPTVSEVAPEDITQNNFSVQLYEGEYQFSGTICAHYSLGDNIFANINYRVKRYKNIRCLLDKSCIAARWVSLQEQVNSDCTDAEKIHTQSIIIESMFLVNLIDALANDGKDPSEFIDRLESDEVLGCVCTCNCADGTPIIPLNPTGDFSVEGCNVTVDTAGLTTIYTVGENYRYILEVAPNGGAVTISVPAIANCTKSQTITFNIATVYAQIKAQINNSTEYNFWASIINNLWDGIDISCLDVEQGIWNEYTYFQRSQVIIDRLCQGAECEAEISTAVLVNEANDVTVSWTNVSGVFEVAAYLDGNFEGAVLYSGTTFTFEGAADGNSHIYTLYPKCSNGSFGTPLTGSFTYFGCPAIAPATVSDANIGDADCPYDLTALVDTLPVGIIGEWHNLNNTNGSSLVVDPTNVTGGTYYVFAKNSDGCYSLGTQVIVVCSEPTACSAPQNLIVEPITGDFRVRFASAAFPPPSNSYTVKRRLTSDPDVSGSYTTIGTPTWNASASRWEIVDSTAIDNTLYTYRAISNCASSAPYLDYIFANLTCPTVTLNPADTSMAYSFTNVGGSVDKYEVRIYDATGVTLIHTDTIVPAFSTPITGTFIYLTGGTTYQVQVRVFIGTYYTVCAFTAGTTDQSDTITGIPYMTLSEPSMSGTIEVTTVGGRTLRFANFSACGSDSSNVTISGGIGMINNNISSGTPNDTQNVDTLLPVGSYTYSGSLSSGCNSSAGIYFI